MLSQEALKQLINAKRGNSSASFLKKLGLSATTFVWTPQITSSLDFSPWTPRGQRPCILVAQHRTMMEELLIHCARRQLKVVLAIVEENSRNFELGKLGALLAELDYKPRFLVALHTPLAPQMLFDLGAAEVEALFSLSSRGRLIDKGFAPDFPSANFDLADLARALHFPVCHAPSELIEAAFLLEQGIQFSHRRFTTLASDEAEAALLADALHTARLEEWFAVQKNAKTVDCLIAGRKAAKQRHPKSTTKIFTYLPEEISKAADMTLTPTGLNALAALLRAADFPASQNCKRPPVDMAQAKRLLDGWRVQLNETQLRPLLQNYGLSWVPGGLCTSASAASQIGAQIGFPVVVKAVGPTLRNRLKMGAIILDVANAMSCRQAFRDVLFACGRIEPSPPLEGVVVSKMAPAAAHFCVTMFWLPNQTALMICSAHQTPRAPLAFSGILDQEAAQYGARALLARDSEQKSSDKTAALTDFLKRLSFFGEDMRGRMKWLRLSVTAAPTAEEPIVQIVDGYAQQTRAQ